MHGSQFMVVLLSGSIFLLYAIKIYRYRQAWQSIPEFRPNRGTSFAGLSVIVAFRNEIDHLEDLIKSLSRQIYPAHAFEVILVDDHSDDGSGQLAMQLCRGRSNFRIIKNAGFSGKKAAIKTGVMASVFEILVTTDADCTMGKYWLSTIGRFQCDMNPDMIIGLVDMDSGNNFFGHFQEMEFLSLIASGAGAAASQNPIYCNAANLVFKKSLFCHLEDPLRESIPSGDDTLFMHALKKQGSSRILLLKSIDAVVQTHGLASLSGFLHQRLRWVSKSRYYRDTQTVYTALLIFSVSLCILISWAGIFFFGNCWLLPLLLIVKAVFDYRLLKSYSGFLGKKLPLFRFAVISIAYPLYVVVMAIAGQFAGFTWKGRYTGFLK